MSVPSVGARAAMARISELQEKHDLVPSAEYYYRYARVWDAVEDWNRALASVVRYLELEGREGQYYRDALALMNNATAALEKIQGPVSCERQSRPGRGPPQ